MQLFHFWSCDVHPLQKLLLCKIVKFHVNLMHRSEDVTIWIFRIFGLKCLFSPQNGGFGDFVPLNVIIHHRDPQKASFKLLTVKIRWGVWPVGESTESVTDTDTGKFIFCPCIGQTIRLWRWYLRWCHNNKGNSKTGCWRICNTCVHWCTRCHDVCVIGQRHFLAFVSNGISYQAVDEFCRCCLRHVTEQNL